jgi:hypothetical protein
MSSDDFSRQLFNALNSYDVNLEFVEDWHKETLESLKSIKEQSKKLKNPRHLGDYLEEKINGILNKYLPKRYSLEKGYGINHFSGISGEQDLLLIDNSLGAAICSTDTIGYYPIECVLASVEVKSTLTYEELRKCIISCINLKKLLLEPFVYADHASKRIFYSIFAYSSKHKPEAFLKRLNVEMAKVPESLRPNCIFIISHGIYLPTVSGYIIFSLPDIQKCLEEFKLLESTEKEKQEAQNFVLFFSLLIEHAFHQSSIREPVKISNYVIQPSIWSSQIEKIDKYKEPVKKFINKHNVWPENSKSQGAPGIEIKCSKCEKPYIFVVIPPGTLKNTENFKGSFAAQGLTPIDRKVSTYSCECGNLLKINPESNP